MGMAIGVVSAVATIAGFLVAIVLYRRQFPKRHLRFAVSVTPLTGPAYRDFELRYRGEAVNAPHLVTIWMRSASRADIPSSAFDANKPITFTFSQRVLGTSSPALQEIAWVLLGSQLSVPPQLLRPRAELEVSLVVEGKPKVWDLESPLIDIAVAESKVLVPTANRALSALIISASGMVVVVVTLLVVALATEVI
jgi:hypothetical protein